MRENLKRVQNTIISLFVKRFKILAYHGVSRGQTSCYDVSVDQFTDQMMILKKEGYQVVDLGEAVQRMISRNIMHKMITITFDDAYTSIFEHAFPILRELGYTATIFVPTGFIGRTYESLNGSSIMGSVMSWEMLSELSSNGFIIGSHSVTHRNMMQLKYVDLKNECEDSYRSLEEHLGCRNIYFAYPFGLYNEIVKETVRSAKYMGALCFGNCMSNWKRTDPFMIKREKVTTNTCLSDFRRIINPNYDIIRMAKYILNVE